MYSATFSSNSATRCYASSILSAVTFRSVTRPFSFWLTFCLKLLSSSFTSYARESRKAVSSVLISTRKALMSACIAAMLADRLSAAASVSAIPSVVFSVFSGFYCCLILAFFALSPSMLLNSV